MIEHITTVYGNRDKEKHGTEEGKGCEDEENEKERVRVRSFKQNITLASCVFDALVIPLFNVWDRTVYVFPSLCISLCLLCDYWES